MRYLEIGTAVELILDQIPGFIVRIVFDAPATCCERAFDIAIEDFHVVVVDEGIVAYGAVRGREFQDAGGFAVIGELGDATFRIGDRDQSLLCVIGICRCIATHVGNCGQETVDVITVADGALWQIEAVAGLRIVLHLQ